VQTLTTNKPFLIVITTSKHHIEHTASINKHQCNQIFLPINSSCAALSAPSDLFISIIPVSYTVTGHHYTAIIVQANTSISVQYYSNICQIHICELLCFCLVQW